MGEREYFLDLLEVTNQRLTDLQKSYRILNDHSQSQEIEIVKLNTKLDTTVSIVKWFISPIAAVNLAIQLLRIWNVF